MNNLPFTLTPEQKNNADRIQYEFDLMNEEFQKWADIEYSKREVFSFRVTDSAAYAFLLANVYLTCNKDKVKIKYYLTLYPLGMDVYKVMINQYSLPSETLLYKNNE